MKTFRIYLLSIISFVMFSNASCQVADTNAISNESFKKIALEKNAVILDVRTAAEFGEGHIPKAINVDVLEESSFKKYIAALPKDRTYLLYCRSGKRSGTALHLMKENGFPDVRHLEKGIVGWDGPTEK